MAWFDGSTDYKQEEFDELFPVTITKNIRLSKDKQKMAIINDLQKDSEYYDLADPKIEKTFDLGKHVFYHIFSDEDALLADKAITEFIMAGRANDGESLILFRKDGERLFSYAYGYICLDSFLKQKEEILLSGVKFLTLSLKVYMFKCPVCGLRTLPFRGCFDVCPECGWEDEGIDDENEESWLANNNCTIAQYRAEYLKKKAADPDYTWWQKPFEPDD